jgi:multicomponent Na+:H+ antiporter subunit C
MTIVLAFLVGGLYAAGLYMMMRRSIVKIIMGLMLLGYGTNVLIFTVGGLTRVAPPIISNGESTPPIPFADPLPQALILTAIVIGFGVLAFAVVLIEQTHRSVGTDDSDNLRGIEGEL